MRKIIIDDATIYLGLAFLICIIMIIKSIFGFFEHLSLEMGFALVSLMLVLRLTKEYYKGREKPI